MRQLAHLWIVLVLLAGCAGAIAPKNVEQGLFHATGQVTAAYRTVADLAARKQIDAETRARLIGQIDLADAAIQAGRMAVVAGDITTAQGRLNAALALLLAVEQSYGARP